MKRADDFRKFMSQMRSVEESFDRICDLPDDVGPEYLKRVFDEFPVAENPYEKSGIRENGLKIWDSVRLPLPRSMELEIQERPSGKSRRSINQEWENITKKQLEMIGRPDGIHYLRPKGEFILDMMNDDIRMFQGAHVLTHRRNQGIVHDDWTFGELSEDFLRNMLKLFLARKFGLSINTHPEDETQIDSFDEMGLRLIVSTKLRNPSLDVEMSGRMEESTVAFILGSFGIESHPSGAANGGGWKELNKWSCMPTLTALVGWECVDYVSHSEACCRGDSVVNSVPASDLQEMSTFHELIDACGKTVECNGHVMKVEEWLDSDDFRKGLLETPQLPCPHCIRLNSKSEGLVPRPRSRKPRDSYSDVKKGKQIPDGEAWIQYAEFMRECIDIGRKATAFASGSPGTMKKRNAEFERRMKIMRRIDSLRKRMISKASRGFIAEAESLLNQMNMMKMEMERK